MLNLPLSSNGMSHSSGIRTPLIPKFLVYTLTFEGIINEIIFFCCSFIIGKLIPSLLDHGASSHIQENHTRVPSNSPLLAVFLRELLPAVKFSDAVCSNGGGGGDDEQLPSECAVCLYEFEANEEIRCLKNCQHIFHRNCIDRWMDQDRNTCPLCRKSMVPVDLRKEYDHRLWEGFCSDSYLCDEDENLPDTIVLL